MKLLKGFTQIKLNKLDFTFTKDEGEFFTWYNESTTMFVKSKNMERPAESGWKYDEIPGREHPNFNNFSLWFEYE